MKKILSLMALSLLISATPAFAEHHETTVQNEEATIQHDVVIGVDGMVCDFCAQSIKKVFGKQGAVKSIDVDLDKGEIIVDFKEGQTLSHDVITKLVVDSGYTIRDMKHAE